VSNLIDSVGPALRGLFTTEGILPRVEFSRDKTDLKSKKASLAADTAPEKVVDTLRKVVERVDDSTRAIYVEDLGTFIVHPVDTSLTGRAAGKVAVVTGAAQGFGLEIAQDLASEGAAVVLADLNEAGAQSAAATLNEQFGAGRALGLSINVTDGASVAATSTDSPVRSSGLPAQMALP
jgi:FlaA1/EpsC-like NDP-sugar epimerase